MSTFMQKPSQVERKWYIIDAAGKPMGRVAAQAAILLRGKHKPTYTPHVDGGDHVIDVYKRQQQYWLKSFWDWRFITMQNPKAILTQECGAF